MLKKFQKNQKGFTLVELMIVVVILGILVAIAVPIFNQVTGNAEKRACQANVRTLDGILTMISASSGIPVSDIDLDTEGAFSGSVTVTVVGSTSNNYIKVWPSCQGHFYTVVDGTVHNDCTHNPGA
jgi:type IV pilus assembly protein PilA